MPNKPTPKAEQPPKRHSKGQMPPQRWQVFAAKTDKAQQISEATALSPHLAQVLINRGIYTPEQAQAFLDPETLFLPSPLDEFPDLHNSLDLLVSAIDRQQKILICGDYDADGMTSTALLLRSLRYLGAQVDYAIPSRMDEGYGINTRIVEEFHAENGAILLTVDNGIAAYDPIARARELGLTVIITDHHEVPEKIPPANTILNPKLIRDDSPYQGVAGVGVAYILAVCLAQRTDKMQDLTAPLLALFTLGTIADLAPLTGVNRRWIKRGLKLLPKSTIPGIQALIEVAGLSEETALKPEAIGFRLGPRINAVGRIADPQIVIDLLTTDDIGVALQRAMQCEEANKRRRQMCEMIEVEAVEWIEDQLAQGLLDIKQERVLVVVQPEWHHGVIGIVASRLVERYGVPVFIGTYENKVEDEAKREIRGSARSIPEFNVFDALQFCDDLLGRYGGHRAAGGFSFEANKLRQVKARLKNFACQHLALEHLKPLVTVDAKVPLSEANLALYSQIDRIHPCGIENPDPVFWAANTKVVEQKVIGKTSSHLKLTLAHAVLGEPEQTVMKAIAWRWGTYYPLPRELDIAYKLRLNEWKGQRNIELELVGVRAATQVIEKEDDIRPWSAVEKMTTKTTAKTMLTPAQAAKSIAVKLQQDLAIKPNSVVKSNSAVKAAATVAVSEPPSELAATTFAEAAFHHNNRRYKGLLIKENGERQLSIQNDEGHLLRVQMSDRQGSLHLPEATPQPVDISSVKYSNLIRAGLDAIAAKQKNQLLRHQDELLAEKSSYIAMLKAQVKLLEDKISQLSTEQQQQFSELDTARQAQADNIQEKETHIEQLQGQISDLAMPTDAERTQMIRTMVGDRVWDCLQPKSQQDLQAAYKSYLMKQKSEPDTRIADYSEAGDRLGQFIEREVLIPFFTDLSAFLCDRSIETLGDIPIGDSHQYSLDMLPPLLADQWRTFPPAQLAQELVPKETESMPTPDSVKPDSVKTVKAKPQEPISSEEKALLTQFLGQWKHPMASCFSQKGRQAASSLDQISQLIDLASGAQSVLSHWQYELMQQLIIGKSGKGGLLRQIFAS